MITHNKFMMDDGCTTGCWVTYLTRVKYGGFRAFTERLGLCEHGISSENLLLQIVSVGKGSL